MLTLLVVGDLHGEERLLEALRERLNARGPWPDLVLFTGDFVSLDQQAFAEQDSQVEAMARRASALQRLREIAPDCFYVGGNHEPFLLWQPEPGGDRLRALQDEGRMLGELGGDLHGRAVRLADGLVMVGLGGSVGSRDDAGEPPAPGEEARRAASLRAAPRERVWEVGSSPAPADQGCSPASPFPDGAPAALEAFAAAQGDRAELTGRIRASPALRERVAALLCGGYPFEALGLPRPCFDLAALGLEPGPARCKIFPGYPFGPFLRAQLPLGPRSAPERMEARPDPWLEDLARAARRLEGETGLTAPEVSEALAEVCSALLSESTAHFFPGAGAAARDFAQSALAALPRDLELLGRASFLANCALQRAFAACLGSARFGEEVRERLPDSFYRLSDLGGEPGDAAMGFAVLEALEPALLRPEERRELEARASQLGLPGRYPEPSEREKDAPWPELPATAPLLWEVTQEAAALSGRASFFSRSPKGDVPLQPGVLLAEMDGLWDGAALRQAYARSSALALQHVRPSRLFLDSVLSGARPPGPTPFDARRDAVILFSHQGAAGTSTSLQIHPAGHRLRETGSCALRKLYDDSRLDLLLHVHGHTHYPVRRVARLGRTVAVNPGKLETRTACLITLERVGGGAEGAERPGEPKGRWEVLRVEELCF